MVAFPRGQQYLVSYEPVGQISNITTYADRVYHAFDRARSGAGTHKSYLAQAGDIVRIGSFDSDFGGVILDGPAEQLLLKKFLPEGAELALEIEPQGTQHFINKRVARDLLASPDPQQVALGHQFIHLADLDL